MLRIWTLLFRVSGFCLGACAVAFMSLPTASEWKKFAGVTAAIFGTICLVAMYFVKKPGAQEEIHVLKRELEHCPPGAGDHHAGDADHHVD